MEGVTAGEATRLLQAWAGGDKDALDKVVPELYSELRRMAHRYVRGQPLEQTLQTTAVVNEAYLRLAGGSGIPCKDRSHFLAICAQLMRHILVDAARGRGTCRRGRGSRPIHFDEAFHSAGARSEDLPLIDEALLALERISPRKAKAIELRFFGGLSVEETAEALGISRETVLRDWRFARAWLKAEMERA
jgi:RNA polymerase sigma factor (TIGR02999 family)